MTLLGTAWTLGELCGIHFSTYLNDCQTTFHTLDYLGNCVYASGFGDGLHEGIVSLVILIVNPQCPLHAALGCAFLIPPL